LVCFDIFIVTKRGQGCKMRAGDVIYHSTIVGADDHIGPEAPL